MAGEDNDDGGPSNEVIQEARTMGWRPKEEYKGNPDKWVDADAYVEKGQHVMPILLENNKRLQKDLLTRDTKIGTLETQLAELKTAQEKLLEHQTKANERDVAVTRANLKERLKTARENDDLDAELDIQEALKKLDEKPEVKPVIPDKKQTAPTIHPEVQEWMDENPWFSSTEPEDKKRAKAYTRIAEDLREEGNQKTGRAFMESVDAAYQKQFGKKDPESDKFDSGTNRPTGSNGAKTYSALPAAAKQACLEDADRLVGPDKKFKDIKAWQTEYAKIYWEND